MRRRLTLRTALLGLGLVLAGCRAAPPHGAPPADPARWWKGNLHTHSLWSDGDDFPDMIADWYRRQGYGFLVMSDHNPPPPEKWVRVTGNPLLEGARREYVARFGPEWVEERRRGDTLFVRLRRMDEYAPRLEEPGRFLLLPGEEITEYLGKTAIHVTASNLAEPIEPRGGASVRGVLQNDVDAVLEQRRRTGRPMIVHVNHPNFVWSLTAEDLAAARGARFFEVYNGHPLVNNAGDRLHPGTERLWDIVLTLRLSAGGEPMYGVATDDAHDYHRWGTDQRNPGRGWVMVRARELTPEALLAAMEAGDFYASTGVELEEVRSSGGRIQLRIRPEPGVAYTTRFVGTRRGYDPRSDEVRDSAGNVLTRRYSEDVGEMLAEVRGTAPAYRLRGDELYVRATVTSTQPRRNPGEAGAVEMAWTQPVVGPAATAALRKSAPSAHRAQSRGRSPIAAQSWSSRRTGCPLRRVRGSGRSPAD